MEQPGLSFLMNLTGNSAVSVAGEAPELLKHSPDFSAVNAFFTIHAGLAAGAEGPVPATMNSAGGGFLGHFDLAGTGFGVDAPEDLTVNSEIDGASEVPDAETFLVQHGFDRRLRGGSVSDNSIEQIDRLDTPDSAEYERGRTRPEFSIGVRVVKNDAPLIAKHAEDAPGNQDNRELPAISGEGDDVRAFKNRASGGGHMTGEQSFASVPAAPIDALSFGEAPDAPALQIEQQPAPSIDVKAAVNIDANPALNVEIKPAHNQSAPLGKTQPFDVATLAAMGTARAPADEFLIGENAREPNFSPRNTKAAIESAPNANAAILAQASEAKRQTAPVNNEVLLDVESAGPASDETRSFEPRFASRSEAGAMTPTVSTAAPVTISAFAAAPAVAERLAGDDIYSAPMIEADAIARTSLSGERPPIQFAPPATTAPAGAAWAQVISAISERNGETKLELRLNPPELGRVTIAFESDGGEFVRAVINADSQQTLDLMRRNIDILQRELARSGLDNVNVELADRDSASHAHDDANERTLAYASTDETPTQLNSNIPLAPLVTDGRLDLRV